MTAPFRFDADATATPGYRPRPQPTMRAAGPRPAGSNRPSSVMDQFLDAIAGAFAPGEDTAGGMLKEMVSPIRAGVQARQAVGEASRAAGQGRVGAALGSAALAAMAVPGVPGPDDAARAGRTVMRGFHGSPKKGLTEFAPNERGIFATTSEDLAREYTRKRGPFMGSQTGDVYEVEAEMTNPLTIDALGKRHDNIPVPWQEWQPKTFGRVPENAVSVEAALQRALADGHDGLVVKNVIDAADPTSRIPSTVYAVKSPEQMRILRALAAAGMVSGAALAKAEQEFAAQNPEGN